MGQCLRLRLGCACARHRARERLAPTPTPHPRSRRIAGGDTVHALHMRSGSAVLELRSSGFARGAPHSWLDLHRRWITRFGGPAREQPLRFFPVLLPLNASVITSREEACFEKNRKKLDAWKAQPEPPRNSSAPGGGRRRTPRDNGWLCYWNADLRVDFDQVLRPVLLRARVL